MKAPLSIHARLVWGAALVLLAFLAGAGWAVQRYFANLRDEEHVILPGFDEANHRAWHLFMVRIKNEQSPVQRDDVITELAARGIQTSVHFIPLHYFTAYQKLERWQKGDFPVAERIFEGAISLPLFPDMTDGQVDEVCHALGEILHPA